MADRGVALNPNSFNVLHYRGWVYKIAGLPEEAVRSWERAARISPVDPLLHRSLGGMGTALIELRRFDEVIVTGKKAQRQTPSYSSAYRCLASAFAHLGRDAEAREAAAHLLEVDPPLQSHRGLLAAANQNRSCRLRDCGKQGCPSSPPPHEVIKTAPMRRKSRFWPFHYSPRLPARCCP